uniref:PHTF1/2 N-terminal domain-containing protein n=1 Tax=Clastoptera arizonana TaxID=38151 RepID=A0A1B6D162_9HEMI
MIMGFCAQEIVSWYQKKIGTYDKQQWEKTVEQRILSSFTHVPKKTAKLKTDLIDVDLVRGSSFTKAKPKHGLIAVTRLAVLRLIFLPAYSHSWIQHTSIKIFGTLLLIYMLQLMNTIFYINMISHQDEDISERITMSEVLVPAIMMFGLSIMHFQIVSPYIAVTQNLNHSRSRRVKRTKRRVQTMARSRSSLCSDSKSSVDLDHHIISGPTDTKCIKINRLSDNHDEENNCGKEIEALDNEEDDVIDDGKFSDDITDKELNYDTALNFQSSNIQYVQTESIVNFDVSSQNLQYAKTSNKNSSCKSWLNYNDLKDQTKPSHHADLSGIISSGEADIETDHKDSDSESIENRPHSTSQRLICRRRGSQQNLKVKINVPSGRLIESSINSSADSEDGEICCFSTLNNEGTTSGGEWIGVTTNSEECSCSSDMEDINAATEIGDSLNGWDYQMSPSVILSPSCSASDKVSCTIWENQEIKKAELSILDISSAIIARVENMPENMDFFYAGMIMSALLASIPSICRLCVSCNEFTTISTSLLNSTDNVLELTDSYLSQYLGAVIDLAFGNTIWERCIVLVAWFERWVLACFFFFFLAVAERTFKQRFLYAKFFSHLTSFRRARKSELPHFRLNKVRNIKSWLSVRSYLKKRGPQRSVDIIVSTSFVVTLLLLSFLSVELLKDSERLHSEYNVEALAWCLVLGFSLLRFMTLGTKINRKYCNLSTIITEQINLYLQIEQKPNKKEELMVANSVLKLAADLLKELESPFKISGLSANPYLYTITKVVILSALSGVLSEMLGFKLKLHKIKIK